MTDRGGAEERVLRIIALLFAVGAVVFGLLALGSVLDQLTSAPVWWTAAALLAILGTAIALGAAAPFAPVRVLRALAASVAIGYLATSVSLPFVFAPVAASGAAPWPLALTALGTTAAALVFTPAVAWGGTLLLGILVAVDRVATSQDDLVAIALQDAAYATFFAAVFVALTLGSRSAARQIDQAAAAADEAAAAAAADRVRQEERARVDALVHDRVLATLLLAGRGLHGSDAAVQQQQAGHALRSLRVLADGITPTGELDAVELADRLRNQVTQLAPWADVELLRSPDARPVPAAVADALVGAASEALRNAVRHAGPTASIALRMEASPHDLIVTVVDDGTGFEPRSVPEGRLGVASSIVGRMRAVGAVGVLRSRPGRGTAVQLIWPAP